MTFFGDQSPMASRPAETGSLRASMNRVHQVASRFDRRRMVALLVAGVVAFVVSQSLGRARATVSELGPGLPTLVATATIGVGASLNETNTALADWPSAFRPTGAVDQLAMGQTATVAVAPGQAISADHLRPDRHGLVKGQRAVTIPMPLAPPPLAVGDHVEVVGLEALSDGLVSAQVLARAGVVEISEETITLAVDTGVAPSVIRFMAVGGIEILRLPRG